jgi:hypothetical protein
MLTNCFIFVGHCNGSRVLSTTRTRHITKWSTYRYLHISFRGSGQLIYSFDQPFSIVSKSKHIIIFVTFFDRKSGLRLMGLKRCEWSHVHFTLMKRTFKNLKRVTKNCRFREYCPLVKYLVKSELSAMFPSHLQSVQQKFHNSWGWAR